jgi:hypothetical protein
MVGEKVTARIQGAVRGATVMKVNEDGSILVACWCPRRLDYVVGPGKYQKSADWNNIATRIEL